MGGGQSEPFIFAKLSNMLVVPDGLDGFNSIIVQVYQGFRRNVRQIPGTNVEHCEGFDFVPGKCLPSLKLPHIQITGEWGFNPPSYPKFSIAWYKQGGILNGAQIFGAMGKKLLGGGEAGPEAVLPLRTFYL